MKNIEVTMEKRMTIEFEATDEEIEMLSDGIIPDRMQKTFDTKDWSNSSWQDYWQDYAVWDCDKEEQIVDFN